MVGGQQDLRADRRAHRRGDVHPPRRPTVRQRRPSHRTRAQQDPQRFRQQVPDDEGQTGALRPRVGLPRPSHRAQGVTVHGRGRTEGAHAHQAAQKSAELCAQDGG